MTAPARYSKKKLVVSPREALVAGGPAEELERTLHSHLAAGRNAILLDLRAVPHLDSAGIRALVRAHTSAERQGGTLTIVNANEQVRSLFQVSHLDRVFNIGDAPDAKIMTPAMWSTVRLIAGGALLVAALLWLGTQSPLPQATAQLFPYIQQSPLPQATAPSIPGIDLSAPLASRVLGVVPLIDLAKLVAAALIGVLVAGVQRRLQRDKPHTQSLEHAKVLLCAAGALMMLIINDNIARAFGIAGAASIIRFRTPIEDAKEITILFLMMGLGMMCGLGSFAVAGVSTAFVCVFLVALEGFGADKPRTMMIEITAKSREFPAAEIETVFALNRIQFERREVSQGEKTVGRYHTTLDPRLSLQNISDQLLGDGTTSIKSIVWEPPKKTE
jgi:anti-anti-sigma factor